MHGTFELTHLEAGKLRDEDFRAAARAGGLEDLLRGLPKLARVRRENLVFDNFAAFLFSQLMSGGDVSDPYDLGGTASAALSCINLMSTSSEPTYQEATNEYGGGVTIYALSETVGSGAKRFVEDVIETPSIRTDPGGREAVECRSRWLFLPSQGVSSNIRSIGVFFSADGDATGDYISRGRMARVRLKDAAGRQIIINKTASQVLLIEYTFRLVSV